MKRIFAVLSLIFVLLLSVALPCLATGQNASATDKTGTLSQEELKEFNETAARIESTYGIELAVLLVPTTDGKPVTNYADDTFDALQYGTGNDKSGLLLVIATEQRQYGISGHGKAIAAFNDIGLNQLSDVVKAELVKGDWAGACRVFFTEGESMLKLWQGGTPYGTLVSTDPEPVTAPAVYAYSEPAASFTYNPKALAPVWYVVALVLGFVLALIPMGVMKRQVKQNVQGREGAADYEEENAFRILAGDDILVNTVVNRTPKPRENRGGDGGHGSSSSSGYTTTHVSSSGEVHSGTSGSF